MVSLKKPLLHPALRDSEVMDRFGILLTADLTPQEYYSGSRGLYEKFHDREHPDIDKFLFDRENFLGLEQSEVRPNVLKAMRLITQAPEVNVVKMLVGSGGGKSYLVSLLLAYKTDDFVSYINPQRYFGLATGTSVAIINLSVNAGQALNIIFKNSKNWIGRIRSFQNIEKKLRIRRAEIEEKYREFNFGTDPNIVPEPYREARAEIEFPEKNLIFISGHSKAASFYGYSVFAGTIDEADHIERATRAKRKTMVEEETTYTEELFGGIRKAIFSRFKSKGLLFLVSTPIAKTAFLTSRVYRDRDEAQEISIDDGHIIVEGETLPKERPECYYRKSPESAVPGYELSIIAPTWVMTGERREKYIKSESDVKALRDFGCQPPDAASGAMPDPEIIPQRANHDRENPWDEQNNVIDFSKMTLDPRATYYYHGDLALVNDNVGHALAHYSHDTGKHTIDFYGNVFTSHQKPFNLDMPINILLSLQQRGYRIGMATFDGFQSAHIIQKLSAMGIPAGQLSADKNKAPYDTLINLHMQDLMDYPPHPQYDKEMKYLEDFGDKYDHPGQFPDQTVGCFTGDTKVKLLDGRHLSFEELTAEFGGGKEFYVYSIGGDGKITVGKAHSPRITKTVTTLIEVELDNGEKIRCTPEHPYMLRGGTYRNAADLTPGASLMPLYAEVKDLDSMSGYEVYYDVSSGKEKLTHRMVGGWLYPLLGYTGERGGNGVIHHIDHNKLNNDPSNLEWCRDQVAHIASYHPNEIMKNRAIPEVEARRIENWNKYYDEEGGREKQAEVMRTNFNNNREKIIEAIRQTGKKTGKANITKYNKSEKHRETASRIGKITVYNAIEARARRDVTIEIVVQKMLAGIEPKNIAPLYDCSVSMIRRRAAEARKRGLLPPKKTLNHKVVSVRVITCDPTPVYDITVDDHHNFALSAGVFVHNSKDIADAAACVVYQCATSMTGILINSEDMRAATDGVRDVNARIMIGDEAHSICRVTEDFRFEWVFKDKMAPLHNRSAYLDTIGDDVLLVIGYKQVTTFIVDFLDLFSSADDAMVQTVMANIKGMKCLFVASAPTAPWGVIDALRKSGIRHVSANMDVSEKHRQKHVRPVRAITYAHISVMIQAIKGGTLKICNNPELVSDLYQITESNYDTKHYAQGLAGWLHYNLQDHRNLAHTPMPHSMLVNPNTGGTGGGNSPSTVPGEKKMPKSVWVRR